MRVVNQIDEEDKVIEESARIIDEENEEEEFIRKRETKENKQKEATYVSMAAQTTVQEKTKREFEVTS